MLRNKGQTADQNNEDYAEVLAQGKKRREDTHTIAARDFPDPAH